MLLQFAIVSPLLAQNQHKLSVADYQLAESRLSYNTESYVDNNFNGRPNWLPGDRFWYRGMRVGGADLVVVDPSRGLRSVCSASTERCDAARRLTPQ